MIGEERAEGEVVELFSIVGLQSQQWKLKLSPDIGVEVLNEGEDFRIGTQRKGPCIMVKSSIITR